MARFSTANDIINRVAVEVGLNADTDPVASTDETYIQMLALLDSLGQELVNLHNWQGLKSFIDATTNATSFDTQLGSGVTIGTGGIYDLPDDFDHMIDQTGWDRTNRVSLGGPLSSQDWSYLAGRDLVSQSIYASFRLVDNKLALYPQPAPDGLRITFEYMSRFWVREQGQSVNNRETVGSGSDLVMYDPLLTIKFLKLKFLQAKGLPAGDAAMEFETMLESRIGKSEGAPVLNASHRSRGYPYLSPYYNTGDSGFGGA